MVVSSKNTVFLFCLWLSLLPLAVSAQLRFTAKFSFASIGKGETVELSLLIENADRVEQITPPILKDFIIMGGPSQESGMQTINGQVTRYIGLTYLLQPKATGKFTLEPATAKADGKILTSNRVTVRVSKTASAHTSTNPVNSLFPGGSLFDEPAVEPAYRDFVLKKGENIQEKISKNIFIKVDVSKTSCYIGEPIVVTYKLYTRLKSESNIIKNPSFNGFSVIDLVQPGNNFYAVETLNGREYNVYTLRKSQLYPLQAGAVELESAEVDNTIRFIKESYVNNQRDLSNDMFRNYAQPAVPPEGMQDERVTLQSKPVIITVNPLPDNNKPPAFAGAVGDFSIDDVVDKTNFTTDESIKLKIAISGAGNMSLINTPDIDWPAGVESFEPQTYEALNKLAVPISGSKYFEYPITVSNAGTYRIPPIGYSFFNPHTGKYVSISTNSITLTVTKGTGNGAAITKQADQKTGKEHFLDKLFLNRWWLVVPVALLIFTGLLVWLRKENKKEALHSQATIQYQQEAQKKTFDSMLYSNPFALSEEKILAQEVSGFYEALNKELRQVLCERLSIPPEALNKKNIAESADQKGFAVSTGIQIQQLLDDIELQLYTPIANADQMTGLFARATEIAHALRSH